jgi:hypothetical protein
MGAEEGILHIHTELVYLASCTLSVHEAKYTISVCAVTAHIVCSEDRYQRHHKLPQLLSTAL